MHKWGSKDGLAVSKNQNEIRHIRLVPNLGFWFSVSAHRFGISAKRPDKIAETLLQISDMFSQRSNGGEIPL